jgi:hypothetical protein
MNHRAAIKKGGATNLVSCMMVLPIQIRTLLSSAPGGTCTPEGHRPHRLQRCAFATPPPTQCGYYNGFTDYFKMKGLRNLSFQNEDKDALLAFTHEGVTVFEITIIDLLVRILYDLSR